MRLVKNIINNSHYLLLLFALIFIFIGNSFAITIDEENEIKSIVNQQLEAFKNDDFEKAYSFASPTIKKMFSSPEVFRKMVIGGYQAVYRPQSIKIGSVEIIKGVATLKVYLVDPNGEFVTANYLMEQQEDGEWLIGGCILSKAESDEI
jgi:hypothetical protein|tara:strand:- start:1481 stop:1927 length:447 start_codon:yes stop_codon:yes gene_type:complete